MTGFWIVAAIMLLIAISIVLVPLFVGTKSDEKRSASGLIIVLAVIPVAVAIYLVRSNFDPEVPMFRGSAAEAVLIEQRDALLENPADINGWRRLAAIYRELGDYRHAAQSFGQAFRRVGQPDDTLKLEYAEALLMSDRTTADGLAGALFDEVLAGDPNNGTALLLGGIAAIESGRRELAYDRFSALLQLNPPPEIEEVIRNQLIVLAGSPNAGRESAVTGPVLAIEVALGDAVTLDAFGPNARLYVLARASDSPMPIAVTQNALSTLPGTFRLDDSNSMAGRTLGDHEMVTVTARISASGTATAAPGDIYDEVTVAVDAAEPIQLVLDKVVTED